MNLFVTLSGKKREGYIFLLTVLFVGTIAFAIMATYIVLAVTSLQNSSTVYASEQALANAYACADHALYTVQSNFGYTGNEVLTLSSGTCTVHEVEGSGTSSRVVCVEGTMGSTSRKFEILVDTLVPNVQIGLWREVATISSCNP